MKTEVERLEEKDTVLLKVEVPADQFSKEIEQAYKRVASQITVPGFRKGKIPKAVIDSRVGKHSVQEEALQKALPGYYMDALGEADIEPIDQPKIDILQIEEGKSLVFTATVKVKPEVKLGKYKGLEVEKPSAEPTEEEINSQIENIRNNFSSLEPVEGRPAKEGDYVLIDFEGFIGDEPFEGGSANDYLLEIGSGTFIPGFEEQLVGLNKGETKDVMVMFPEDYASENLAGKEARFSVTVKEIKEKNLQEVTDDFAKQVGYDTVDEMKAAVSDKIREVKAKHADTELKNRVIDQATDNAEIDIPDVMVEHELDEMVEDFEVDVKRQGLELQSYLDLVGATVESLRDEWRDRAETRVKNRMVLEEVAKAENIEVTPEEVDEEIGKAAAATGRDFEEVKQIFAMKGTIGTLKNRILIGKTIDWLVDNSVTKEEKEKEQNKETEENQSSEGTE